MLAFSAWLWRKFKKGWNSPLRPLTGVAPGSLFVGIYEIPGSVQILKYIYMEKKIFFCSLKVCVVSCRAKNAANLLVSRKNELNKGR